MFDQNENATSLEFAEYPLKKQKKSFQYRKGQGSECVNFEYFFKKYMYVLSTRRLPRVLNEAFQHVNLWSRLIITTVCLYT